ncbi:PIG-L family deacetylase [Rhodococcus sp. HNM0569]|uniref:PIG-L family deacetylase n=1 Tax=Rhodococcus sp. HNM0569 TaxID=2716340 RepID=UPI00146B3383|nr:PIG-L family deacetylase [Rhodococcus sp. HNM0569]NLU84081.1 GlcNAc-PI de-N-acetylase [Rhodococcus sp. HNM0569]
MSVLVCFHAHPDDEVFTTGGVMRLAADAGHRVVLVTATDGALGEVPDGLLADGEALADRRRRELEASADVLGAHRVVMLPYADSGMAGAPTNSAPRAFAGADVASAAARLAEVLRDERADVVTVYDPHGGYGHPDHVQVHRVGVHAADLAGVEHVYEATTNRDHVRTMMSAMSERAGADGAAAEAGRMPDLDTFGLPDADITTAIDVSSVIAAKRAAMRMHASQIGDFGPFLELPDDMLVAAFGTEWFRRRGTPPGQRETMLPL